MINVTKVKLRCNREVFTKECSLMTSCMEKVAILCKTALYLKVNL